MRTLQTGVDSSVFRLVWRLLLILGFSVSIPAQQLPADSTPITDRVLIIRNANSVVSRSVADDYIKQRGVRHTLTIACPDSAKDTRPETISFKAFQMTIEAPLRAFLMDHPSIDFIVLTKGIPIRLADAPQGAAPGRLALDSYLASWQYQELTNSVRVDVTDPNYGSAFHGLAWANRFWNSRERFSHSHFGGYLVTRLDGYTEADAKALTARSIASEKALDTVNKSPAKVLLDVCPGYGFEEKSKAPHSLLPVGSGTKVKIIQESKFGEFNSDMQWASEILAARHVPVDLELTDRFVGNGATLAGYVSWGSNDQHFEPAVYRSLRFVAGALCETAVSTSARTFLPTKGGQSLIADLIERGATGAKGYTDEPLLQAVASPSILLERYTRGWTLAESYYAASRLVGWQDVVIGDPLCRSYPETHSDR
jgi:uncharacterized protein (TIGR03790 family)